MKKLNIMFFGDSICTGQHVAIHQGWVTRTSARLYDLGKKHSAELMVTNASVNGRTTRQALECIHYEVQSHCPDAVIIQFGMNDCNYWESDKGLPRVSRQAFAANLCEIIARVTTFGARRIFLNTNHPTTLDSETFPHTNITYQQSNESYNQAVRELSEDLDVVLNDVERCFLDHVGGEGEKLEEMLLSSDQLHLSKKGHDLYLDYTYPRMERAVLELLNDG
ncbi:MAG: SGNH/GDSL hydrolase family protein [Opitutales bacterium]